MRIRVFADRVINEMREVMINGKPFKPAHYARIILNDYLEITS